MISMTNAEKALRRAGFAVTLGSFGPHTEQSAPAGRLIGRRGGYLIECLRNGREDLVATIRMRRESEKDDPYSDYFAGSFYKTLKRAIDTVARWQADDARERSLVP